MEFGFGPPEECGERWRIETVTNSEVGLIRGCGEAVPRTGKLAIIAAINAVSDERPQRLRYGALVLDGEIGDTASGVELIWRHDGACWTHIDAFGARAAVIGRRRIDRQRQVGVDLAEEEVRTGFPVEQQRVLAAPAEPRFLGERDFHNRGAVGESAVVESADAFGDAVGEALQPAPDDFVVVA